MIDGFVSGRHLQCGFLKLAIVINWKSLGKKVDTENGDSINHQFIEFVGNEIIIIVVDVIRENSP